MKKIFIVLSLLISFNTQLFANDSDTLAQLGFTGDQIATLLKGERLDNLTNTESKMALMPVTPLTNQLRAILKEKKPATIVEALYYLPGYTGVEQLKLYNSLLKLSSLSGLEYYSRSEKRIKTLIYNVQVLTMPGSKETLPDPTVTVVPEKQQFYIQQNDETFGVADYEVQFFSDSNNSLGIAITNLSDLKQHGIKMAAPREMETLMVAIPLNDGVLLYAVSSNKKAAPAILRGKMNESLLNRLDAFKNWFSQRYRS